MSGGSFNYLCFADTDEISNRISDMEDMRNALAGYGVEDFAKITQDFILEIRRQEAVRTSYLDKLERVWKAVEWKNSLDYDKKQMYEIIEEERKCVTKG
jgi:hypothetical protein